MIEMRMDAEIEDVIYFFLKHRFGKTKGWDLAPHEPAAFFLFVVKMQFIPKRCEIARDGQGCWASAEKSDLFTIRSKRPLRHQRFNFPLVVSRYTLQTAY